MRLLVALGLGSGLALLGACLDGGLVTLDAGPRDAGSPAGQDGGARAGTDAGPVRADGGPRDAGEPTKADAGGSTSPDGGAATGHDGGSPPTPPAEEVLPVPGELSILQLYLPGVQISLEPPLGEAAIIVGPEGSLLLLDVGNGSHDDDVRERIRTLNTEVLTPARGYPARGPLQVEYVVLTHYHRDHIGAFEALMVGSEPLTGVLAVVHRGFTDVGAAVTESDYEEVCTTLTGPLASVDVPLCDANTPAPCDPSAWSSSYPATGCPGLPMVLDLGAGAELTLVAANAHVTDGVDIEAMTFGVDDSGQENGRSLVGIVTFGSFRYHLGGDLTGTGDVGDPDVETHLIEHVGAAWYGTLGVDVTHAHHHVRDTSSNPTLVDALAPADGRSRNVVGGINPGHVGSPQPAVLAAWGDDGRLGTGRIWVTNVAATGADHAVLENADGEVNVHTRQAGDSYWIQAVPDDGSAAWAGAWPSVRQQP